MRSSYTPERWVVPTSVAPAGGSWPLAFLLALQGEREEVEGLRVSSLLESPLRACLKARRPYYLEPHEMLYMVDGSAVHWWLARASNAFEAEKRLTVDVPVGLIRDGQVVLIKVTGKPDHYDPETRTLTDYKRMTTYGLKMILKNGLEAERPEYVLQLGFYAEMLRLSGEDPKPPYKLVVWASDWQKPFRGGPADPRFGIFDVNPVGTELEELRSRALAYIEMEGRELTIADACDDRVKFGVDKATNLPKRCKSYCSVNRFCPWWTEATKES